MEAPDSRTAGDGIARLTTLARVTLLVLVVAGAVAGLGTAAAENVTSADSAGDVPPAEAGGLRLPGGTVPVAFAGVLVGLLVTVAVISYRERS
jgi:hypothetical protein